MVTSFLGAHAIPEEYRGRADDYITEVCLPALDTAHAEGLVDAVDGFMEHIAFSGSEIERVFAHAIKLGLPLKLHADQLSDLGGAALAARFGALSADHVEYTSEIAVRAMADAGTVAVLLPGAFFTLGEERRPSVDGFSKARCANGGGDGRQSRIVPPDLHSHDDEHGLHPVRADTDRSAGWRDKSRGRRFGARGLRENRSRMSRRSRGVGCRDTGGAQLPDRIQSTG